MSKYIQLISYYPPHERIKIFLKMLKRQGAKVSQLSRGYCIKLELTSV